ncbi:MAG: transporter substrate-binding domain-containing protein [Clostridia bacterium]|nr:transporter substrate-binding domain-containing protein [Clostridia bacterium]
MKRLNTILAALLAALLILSFAAFAEEAQSNAIDKEAFDALVASGPVADDDTVAASQWASKVKAAGKLRVGTTAQSFLFSLLDEEDGHYRGFDAGLYQLLANYIFGDPNAWEFTQVTSSTREDVLISDQVDAVFATYSILPSRQEVISFAGPYFTSKQGILIAAGNEAIKGLDELAGKGVATQQDSSGPAILAEYAPEAIVQEEIDDETARQDVEVGRADAYVTDYTLILGSIVRNPGKYAVAGIFGEDDNYGIGLPKDSDGVAFVNDFLKQIEEAGLWTQLWQISLGDRTGGAETAPEPPVIGE